MRAFCILLLVTSTMACRGDDGATTEDAETSESGVTDGFGDPVPLIDNEVWVEVSESEDPLAAHRPEILDCSIAGFIVEQGFDGPELELNTGECNYLALDQPTLAPIEVGDRIHLDMYHFDLTSPVDAESHVALLLGGEVVWERTIPIGAGPEGAAPAEVFDERWVSQIAAPVGTRIGVHLHNHGQNTWNLKQVSVEPASPAD